MMLHSSNVFWWQAIAKKNVGYLNNESDQHINILFVHPGQTLTLPCLSMESKAFFEWRQIGCCHMWTQWEMRHGSSWAPINLLLHTPNYRLASHICTLAYRNHITDNVYMIQFVWTLKALRITLRLPGIIESLLPSWKCMHQHHLNTARPLPNPSV